MRYTIGPLISHPPDKGALPQVMAALDPDVKGGEYYGPGGLGEMTGWPKRVGSNPASRDTAVAAKLWQVSEELSGVRYDALAQA